MSGIKPLIGTIFDFFGRKVSVERRQLVYAHSPNVARGNLSGGMAYTSNCDFPRSVLINDGVSEAATSYYGRVRECDLLARVISCCTDVEGGKNVLEDCL